MRQGSDTPRTATAIFVLILFFLLPSQSLAQRAIVTFRDSTRKEIKIQIIGKIDLGGWKTYYPLLSIAKVNFLDSLDRATLQELPILYENGIVVERWGKTFSPASLIAEIEATKQYKKPKAGDVRLRLSLPWLNNINAKTPTRDNRFGFFGEGIGIEYSYSDRRFIELEYALIATSQTFFTPDVQNPVSYGFALSHNHLIGRVSFGYGVTYAVYQHDYDDSLSYAHSSAGAVLKSHYRIGRTLHIGIVYRPTFYRFDATPTMVYEHSLSIEAAWRFRIASRN